jgi:hypothetical protein
MELSPDQIARFEDEYDGLGPIEFVEKVVLFGGWLGRHGGMLAAADRREALARFAFLRDRLSFWLNYDHKPIKAQDHLIAAVQALYQGAEDSGVASVDDKYTDSPGQDRPWQSFVGRNNPTARTLPPGSTTFDHFECGEGNAISSKTLNTLGLAYMRKPELIYEQLKSHVDSAADYRPRSGSDIELSEIRSRTIHLAVPEGTAPIQWRQIMRAITYGRGRGVMIIVTKIRS